MGLLDDAIREHLELKRRHGADPAEVERQEREVLGADAPRPAAAVSVDELDDLDAPVAPPPPADPVLDAETVVHDAPFDEPAEEAGAADEHEDVLEDTPEFLEETPEHDRLWFEQRPPKDFDF
jgi:hypothetical protein